MTPLIWGQSGGASQQLGNISQACKHALQPRHPPVQRIDSLLATRWSSSHALAWSLGLARPGGNVTSFERIYQLNYK
jgi:hypothetical protein